MLRTIALPRLPLEGTTQVALSCLFEAIHLELSPQATDEVVKTQVFAAKQELSDGKTPHPVRFANHLPLKGKALCKTFNPLKPKGGKVYLHRRL